MQIDRKAVAKAASSGNVIVVIGTIMWVFGGGLMGFLVSSSNFFNYWWASSVFMFGSVVYSIGEGQKHMASFSMNI